MEIMLKNEQRGSHEDEIVDLGSWRFYLPSGWTVTQLGKPKPIEIKRFRMANSALKGSHWGVDKRSMSCGCDLEEGELKIKKERKPGILDQK